MDLVYSYVEGHDTLVSQYKNLREGVAYSTSFMQPHARGFFDET